jgi:hypothetical protein
MFFENSMYDYDNEPGNDNELGIYIHEQALVPIYRIICVICNCCVCHTE